MTLRLVELFAGIGSQAKAIENLGVKFRSTVCEIDSNAYRSYCAIHGYAPNLGDITQVKALPECDIVTWSFPCQELSICKNGKGLGMSKNSGSRSALCWEVIRVLDATKNKPQFLIMENVPTILHKNNRVEFEKLCSALSMLGYVNSYKILNSKDFGTGQARKRCFMVSELNGDKFQFEYKAKSPKTLKDYLVSDVSQEFFMKINQMAKYTKYDKERRTGTFVIAGNLNLTGWHRSDKVVYSENSMCPTLCVGGTAHKVEVCVDGEPLVRRLTPLEYWRLMGFTDDDYTVTKNLGVSNTTMYRLAANSICVPVLEYLFSSILEKMEVNQ